MKLCQLLFLAKNHLCRKIFTKLSKKNWGKKYIPSLHPRQSWRKIFTTPPRIRERVVQTGEKSTTNLIVSLLRRRASDVGRSWPGGGLQPLQTDSRNLQRLTAYKRWWIYPAVPGSLAVSPRSRFLLPPLMLVSNKSKDAIDLGHHISFRCSFSFMSRRIRSGRMPKNCQLLVSFA